MRAHGLLVVAWVASCAPDGIGDGTGDPPECDDPALTWEGFAQPFFSTWCTSCHGSDLVDDGRHGAPSVINFDTLAGVLPYVAMIQSAAVDGRRMPPTDAVPAEDRARLGDWITCGTPGTDVPAPEPLACDAPRLHEGDVVSSAVPDGACTEWDAVSGNLTLDAPSALLSCLCEVQGDLAVTAEGPVVLPEIVTVGGNLLVQGASALTTFDAPYLGTVTGDLFVTDDPAITFLNLPRLRETGGAVVVARNPALVDVPSMEALLTVGGSVQFVDLVALAYVDAAPNATTIGGRLNVTGNSQLVSLWVGGKLAAAPPEILVADNPVLTSIAGLGEITEVASLTFRGLPALEALPDMGRLHDSAELTVADTDTLATLGGLSDLRTVSGSLTIDANTALTDVSALKKVTSIGGDLTVTNNPKLSEENIDELLDAIGTSNVAGAIEVWGNAD